MITCIGSAIIDVLFYTDEGSIIQNRTDARRQRLMAFEFGGKIASRDVFYTFGGSAANTTMTFARLGVKTEILTAVGYDGYGNDFARLFRLNGIGIRLLQRVKNGKTGQSFIISSKTKEDHVSFVHRGASDAINLNQATVSKITTPWVYLTALSDSWRPKVRVLFKGQNKLGFKVAWNPGIDQIQKGYPIIRKYLSQTEVLLVNIDEALEIIYRARYRISNKRPRTILPILHRGGQRISVITAGAQGAYVYDGARIYYHGSLARDVRNTNGAGDAFGSGFVTGLMKKRKIDSALKLGLYNSAAVIHKIGAQTGILSRSQMNRLPL